MIRFGDRNFYKGFSVCHCMNIVARNAVNPRKFFIAPKKIWSVPTVDRLD